jgi:hypothetical protein
LSYCNDSFIAIAYCSIIFVAITYCFIVLVAINYENNLLRINEKIEIKKGGENSSGKKICKETKNFGKICADVGK